MLEFNSMLKGLCVCGQKELHPLTQPFPFLCVSPDPLIEKSPKLLTCSILPWEGSTFLPLGVSGLHWGKEDTGFQKSSSVYLGAAMLGLRDAQPQAAPHL